MKFVVTGGAGFIGHHIVKDFVEGEHEVVVLDNLCTGRNLLADFEGDVDLRCIDVRTASDVASYITADTDWVIHCAAVLPHQTNVEALWDVNVHGTFNVLQAAARHETRVIFLSSAAVYGDTADLVTEHMELLGQSMYAASKIAGEALTRAMMSPDRYYILRLFNVYGPGGRGVVNRFVSWALGGHSLVIHGDGNQMRDFIHVNDAVRGVVFAVYGIADERIVNVCTGKLTSVRDLAHMIAVKRPGIGIQHDNSQPGIYRSGGDPWLLFGRVHRCKTLEYHVDRMLKEGANEQP